MHYTLTTEFKEICTGRAYSNDNYFKVSPNENVHTTLLNIISGKDIKHFTAAELCISVEH